MDNIKKILIRYNKEERIIENFWKYFFQTTGIWVKSECISENMNFGEEVSGYSVMYILNNSDIDKMNELSENALYIVKRNATFKAYRRYENICVFNWWKEDTYYTILEKLFGMKSVFEKLMNIFIKNNLWLDAWLYHELAQVDNEIWDRQITEDCNRSMKQLGMCYILFKEKGLQDIYYIQYMYCYCCFLKLGVTRIDSMEIENGSLLRSISILASKNGWDASLLVLGARTCALSSITRIRTLRYFLKANEIEESAGLLYDIGKEYENLYNKGETAYLYYQKAIEKKPFYFRALYKIALQMEGEQKWADAIYYHRCIVNMMPDILKGIYVSVAEVEYTYKANKHLKRIYIEKLGIIEEAAKYEANIERLKKYVREDGFDKLIHCMTQATRAKNVETIYKIVKEVLVDKMQ